MSRKTRREKKWDKKMVEAVSVMDHVDITKGLSDDEFRELEEYWEFHTCFHKQERETSIKVNKIYSDISHLPGDMMTFLTKLSREGEQNGFESLVTYWQYLKLIHFEEDGVYSLLSEDEQVHIKRWVHMKKNFLMKREMGIEMATPESNHVWIVPDN